MTSPATAEHLEPATARWLGTPAGREAVAAARRALASTGDTLRAGQALGAAPPAHRAAAVACAVTAGEVEAALGGGGHLLFTGPAWEQASHPAVSAWRARRFAAAQRVVDLCCGAGADALALAAAGPRVLALDRDEARVVLADHNAGLLGAPVGCVVADARHPPVDGGEVVHCDPSRRRAGGRARRLADYAPPVPTLRPTLEAAAGAGLVLSPGVDLDDPDLPPAELEFIQHGRDLVEATAWMGALRTPGVVARASLLPGGHTVVRSGPVAKLPAGPPGEWVLEVAPAAIRARLHDLLGAGVGARRISRRRALLTTDEHPGEGPWWRLWRLEAALRPRPREVRRHLRTLEEAPLEIATAGVDADPEGWWRRLGSPPRGPGGRRLLLVRLEDGARALLLRGAPLDSEA